MFPPSSNAVLVNVCQASALPPELRSSPYCFSYFQEVSCTFAQGWSQTMIFLPMDQRCTPPYAAYWLRWGLAKFCLGWPWTMILFISASQVLGLQVWTTVSSLFIFSFTQGLTMQARLAFNSWFFCLGLVI
jgi:hypothetical protein